MNDYSAKFLNAKMPSSASVEFNNNSERNLHLLDSSTYRQRSESRASTISSASSSETSDDLEAASPETPGCTPESAPNDKSSEEPDIRRFRSMSDGATSLSSPEELFQVFPSLPDSVLEKMGLLGDQPRERMNEEELEQKFVALALAFTIDAATIKDRCERQRRYRDQTETNLAVEIERLLDKVNRLQPLCVDAETTELLTDLLAQVDVVMRASSHAATSAERFGAVQHEERLAQSVHLMINHVTVLKQQRDSARRHLQYTKRMLQDSNNTELASAKVKSPQPNGRMPNRRRASIASISQPFDPTKPNNEVRKIARRTSELSLRASALPRSARPSRLELGVDLVKIREGTVEGVETNMPEEIRPAAQTDSESEPIEFQATSEETQIPEPNFSRCSLTQRIRHRLKKFGTTTRNAYKTWSDAGVLHELFCFASLMCFSLSIISLGNILMELEYARRGASPFCSWSFENSLIGFLPFLKKEYNDGAVTS